MEFVLAEVFVFIMHKGLKGLANLARRIVRPPPDCSEIWQCPFQRDRADPACVKQKEARNPAHLRFLGVQANSPQAHEPPDLIEQFRLALLTQP